MLMGFNLFGCMPKTEAGTDSGIVRDGTPRKYFTISCDDGITQDARIIEILKKYHVKGTFFINSGLLGEDISDMLSKTIGVEVTHKRWTKEEIQNGVYEGMDVACHTYTHPSMKDLRERERISEIKKDVRHIAKMTGIIPVGMAWPGGDSAVDDESVRTVAEKTSIRFARCTTATGTFELPKRFLRWYPTASALDGNVLQLADTFLQADCTKNMLFYVWLHGYELDAFDAWDTFETLIEKIASDENVIVVTNSEFYRLFSSEIPS